MFGEEDPIVKKKRYTEEQIVRILGEVERGKTVVAVCREYGVSEQTVHRWKSKYRGMSLADVQRLRELEKENGRLKKLVADQALDNAMLKELLGNV